MSLRFLKAKPKLNLSKDNKVRSVASKIPRTEPNSTDGQETGNCTLIQNIPGHEKNTESELTINSNENNSSENPSITKSLLTNEKSGDAGHEKGTQGKIPSNTTNSQSSVENVSSKDTNITQLPTTTKESKGLGDEKNAQAKNSDNMIDSKNISGNSSRGNSITQTSNKKFNYLKAKPKLNFPKNNLQGGEDVLKCTRDATIQRALENDKVIIHSIDSQNVTGNASMKESTSKECDPTVLKKDTKGLQPSDKINSMSSALSKSSSQKSSVTKVEKVSPTKTKSLSSYIKQLENEALLCSQKSSMKSVDKEQKYTKHEECKNVNPIVVKASQEMKTNDQIIENDTKLGDEIKKPTQQEQKHTDATESKSLNSDTVTFSKTRTVFNKGIGNQEKSGDEIKIAKQQEKILTTYQDMNRVKTSTDIKTEDLNKVIEHNKKLGNDTKKHSIQQDFFCTQNEESKNLDSNAVEVSNELNTQDLNKTKNHEKISSEKNELETRQTKDIVEANLVQTKVQNTAYSISENMKLLNDPSNTVTYVNKITSPIKLPDAKISIISNSPNIISISASSKTDVGITKGIILNEENINSIPIIIAEPQKDMIYNDVPAGNHVPVELLDHVYSKNHNIYVAQEANTHEIVNCFPNCSESNISYTKPEINLDNGMKTFSRDKTKKNQSNSISLPALNPYHRSLLLKKSKIDEASECVSRPFVDVNTCTYNTSYSLQDSGSNAFAGLSLVARIIKEEAGDPFQEDPLLVSDYIGAPDDNSNSNNVEEEAYADHTIDTYEDNGSCYVHEGTDQYDIIPLTNSVQNQDRPDSIADIKDAKARKRKNVTFNLEREPYENSTSETSGSPIQNPTTSHKKHQKNTNSNISYLTDLSDCSINNDTQKEVLAKKPRISRKPKKNYVDNDLVNSHIESTINDVIESSKKFDELAISSGEEDIDNEQVKEEYDPDYKLEYESGSDIDNDEREFVIYGKKNTGGKKKVSDSIYLKRQSETLKKIKTESDWKETLTLNDLIFYNPSSNPMTNPPDISVVNKNEKIIDMEKENNISEDEEAVDNPEPVPQLKIGPDGKLIIDPKSLIIQETGLEKSKKRLERSEALLESKYTIKKIDNLYTKKKFKPIMNEWGPEDTIMFYRAVNTIGTDFSMMATLFENRTRADIKRKFKLEERKNSALLSKALRDFNNFDIDELKSELDADKRRIQRIKEEENERKRVLKEEKKNEKLALQRSRRTKKCTSLCGQLTQNSSLRSDAAPQYAPPHPKIFQLVKENRYKQLYNQE